MNKITSEDLNSLAAQAKASPRLRMNRNVHADLTDPIQRLAIAMEPGTYIRPHRHEHTWELLTALKGRFVVLTFDDQGVVIDRAVLGDTESVTETPQAGWHAVLSLDEGGVIFEVKHGPYAPFEDKDFAPWSPKAEEPVHQDLMHWYKTAELGQQWPGIAR